MSDSETLVKGVLKPCCTNKKNLGPPEVTGVPGEHFRRCRVCGCRHFRSQHDYGTFGIRGSGFGKKRLVV